MPTLQNSVDSNNATTAIGGAVPGANDTVLFNQYTQDFYNGLDLSTNGADLYEFLPGCKSSFGYRRDTGQFTGYLMLKTSAAGIVRWNWGGDWAYFSGASAATVIYQVEIGPSGPGKVVMGAMDNERTWMSRGKLTVNATCDMNKLTVGGGVADVNESGSYTLTDCEACGAGLVNLLRGATNLRASGGGTVRAMLPGATHTNGYLHGGTIVVGCLSLTNLYSYGGTLDLTQAVAPLTFTATGFYAPTRVLLSRRGVGVPNWGTSEQRFAPEVQYVD